MPMPFKIWQDHSPAKLYILRIKHDIYYQLNCIYHQLCSQLKSEYYRPEELPLLKALNNLLITGLTLPLPSLSDSLDKLKTLQQDFHFSCLVSKELEQELNEVLKQLQKNPETPVFSALERLFLDNSVPELANIQRFNFSLKYSCHFDMVSNVFHEHEFNSFSQLSLLEETLKKGSNHPLILTGLTNWYQRFFKIPPAKNLILITPSWYSTKIKHDNPFTTYADITIGLSSAALVLPAQISTLTLYTDEKITQEQFIDDELITEPAPGVDLMEKPLSQLKLANDWITFEPGKKTVIVSSDHQVRYEPLHSISQLTIGEYWVDVEDKNETDSIINPDQDTIAQMEIWKKPMRRFATQPNLLVKKLRSYGATSRANEQNVCHWMKPSHNGIFAPQDLENDFRAILHFANIPVEYHQGFIQLINKLRSTNRSQGRITFADLTNQMLSELKALLSTVLQTDVDSLQLQSTNYIFQLRKITDLH
ncbi:hypothetical protein [Zophobihabitans entericus]|uniref:Uncharacterized protein n=1 Tax=Zophobihabitans entericus TaxID=1635327 RepID=A0A6G9IAZ6_9GAMM|nr:hypothetical protein [Zophobihabitans entericus]QIQ21007.1 hypothetical protein IPMB12_04520 [Zophobihabitans entericus]